MRAIIVGGPGDAGRVRREPGLDGGGSACLAVRDSESDQETCMDVLEQLRQRLTPFFPGLLGIEITEAGPDRVRATLKVRREICTVGDTLHGGALMAFADTVGAVATFINLPEGARTTTLESKTNFLRAAPVGTVVTAEATPFHNRRTTMDWQKKITDEDGRLCSVVTQTQMVLPA